MTDLLGPASSLNAVSQRPSDGRNFGSLDTWFRDCTTPASQDGTQVTAGWLNGVMGLFRSAIRGNGFKADGVTPVIAEDQSDGMLLAAVNQLIQRGQAIDAADTGVADALAIAPAGTAAAEYKVGMAFRVRKGPAANLTTAPTLNVSGLGPVPMKRRDGTALHAGDLQASTDITVRFDGTAFRVQGLVKSDVTDVIAATATGGNGSGPGVSYVADAGTADALAGPGAPTLVAYTVGQAVSVKKGAAANATTTPTLAVDGLAPKTIVKANGAALAVGDLPANTAFWALYDGTNFRLLEPTASDIATIVATFTATPGDGCCYASVLDINTIQVLPKNGNAVYVNGVPVVIPSTGLKVVNVVNGLPATPNTLYYLYLAGVTNAATLELSTTGHVSDSAGREVKIGDASRRLLAMALTDANGHFVNTPTQPFLRNWFNRKEVLFDTGVMSGTTVAAGASSVVGTPITVVCWGDEITLVQAVATTTPGGSSSAGVITTQVNGTSAGFPASIPNGQYTGIGGNYPIFSLLRQKMTEGANVIQVYATANANNAVTFAAQQFGTVRG